METLTQLKTEVEQLEETELTFISCLLYTSTHTFNAFNLSAVFMPHLPKPIIKALAVSSAKGVLFIILLINPSAVSIALDQTTFSSLRKSDVYKRQSLIFQVA